MKRTLNKDLKIGQRYWIFETGQRFSKFRRPLVFIGYKSKRRTPWFTFGESPEDWEKNFNFVAPPGRFSYYEAIDWRSK